ncbi:hypothetical protein L2X67_18465, partial [Enterobacter ludwigii]|nr:hypothetical protein [Enterobacter ludwigii]
MIRYFSFYIFGAILSFFSFNSLAGSDLNSIVKNKDIDACSAKNGGDNSECLRSVSQLTEKKLNTVYEN